MGSVSSEPPGSNAAGADPPFSLDIEPPGTLTPRLIRRFWKRFSKPGAGCWELQVDSMFDESRYWFVSVAGRYVYAHRFAFELFVGPIPRGMMICHRCDNPSCVNPSHLFIGTAADNVGDMVRKGRNHSGKKLFVKLTDDQVSEIRRRIVAGESQRAIAREFGITSGYASRLARGKKRLSPVRSAILSEDDKQAVRELFRRGDITRGQLAAVYGVSVRYIDFVLHSQPKSQIANTKTEVAS